VFHLELRQSIHVTRAFNLARDELERRILGPWVRGAAIELNDRRWEPQRARLTIYEGAALGVEEIGLGRGWAQVTRTGAEVTAGLLADARLQAQRGPGEPALASFKAALIARCASGPSTVGELVAWASELHPGWRVSERLGLVERAVWELLHEGAIELHREHREVGAEEWEALLLAWTTWAPGAGSPLLVRAS